QPNRIGMRGAGNVNLEWLSEQNSDYYKSGYPKRVAYVCHNGEYLASGTDDSKNGDWKDLPNNHYNYKVIPGAYRALPESQPLADVDATKRSEAWPVTYKVTIS